MASKIQLVEAILAELSGIQNESSGPRIRRMESGFPAMIGVGDGRMIFVSPSILAHIRDFSDLFRNSVPGLSTRISAAEFAKLTQTAFGSTLIERDLDQDRSALAHSILEEVNDTLNAAAQEARDNLIFVFGARLFSGATLDPFEIGPVRFESRESWLQRASKSGQIDAVTTRRVRARWEGKYVRKRKPSWNEEKEHEIAKITANCRYICSVQTHDLASKTGEQRALLAARLALAVIALLWASPSKALEGMGLQYDGEVFRRRYITMDACHIRGMSSSIGILPDGPNLPKDWDDLFLSARWLMEPLADALHSYTNPGHAPNRPNISSALLHSLMWFHEACKERLPVLATVKFAASMDALAKGKGKPAIARFINARMGLKEDQRLMKRGQTATELLNQIYDYARSRTIHGSNAKLTDDWTDVRASAESVARLCIHLACGWVADHPDGDRVEDMAMASD